MRAFLFPGQGSQAVGMGKALASNFAPARQIFEEVDGALGSKKAYDPRTYLAALARLLLRLWLETRTEAPASPMQTSVWAAMPHAAALA